MNSIGIDERVLEQFFYCGIDNIKELLEGIVYFSTIKMHKLYPSLEEQYKTPNDIQLSQIKNIAYKYGIQYYRFIELNQIPNKLVNYKTENELQKVKHEINSVIEEVINKKSLIENSVGYYYSAEEEGKFLTTYQKDNLLRRFWAIEIAEQLEQLSIQEENNPIEYYKNWLKVRLKMAESRKQKCDSEIQLIKSLKKQFDERLKQAENIKDDNEKEQNIK